jgi:hypothetical protein
MLNYNILNSKPLIKIESDKDDSSTVVCKDLAANSINPRGSIENFTVVEITKEYIARPDLVSLAMYGTDEYADIICKVNGLSNPFELNAGMQLLIPAFSNVTGLFKRSVKSDFADDSSTIGKVAKTNQKAKNETRNPAEQTIGDSTFVIDKANKIVYY